MRLTSLVVIKASHFLLVGLFGTFSMSGCILPKRGIEADTVATSSPKGQRDRAPNIIVVILDDLRWDQAHYLASTHKYMTEKGRIFANAFATTPVCCPSRASLLTASSTFEHKVYNVNWPFGGAKKFKDSVTLATDLKNLGYQTGLFGKYLNNYEEVFPRIPPGWDSFNAFLRDRDLKDGGLYYFNFSLSERDGSRTDYKGRDSQNYSTNVIGSRAIAFVREATTSNTPFFLYLAPFAPHPWGAPDPVDRGRMANLPPWRPRSYNEDDVSDKPHHIRVLKKFSSAEIDKADRMHRSMTESLLSVDRQISWLIQLLDETREAGNTYLVVTSDQGLSWGEHRILDKKQCPYDECTRVPLWIAGPGIQRGEVQELVTLKDVGFSLSRLAGGNLVGGVGVSDLRPLLFGETISNWRTEVVIDQEVPLKGPRDERAFMALRGQGWLFVEYLNSEEVEYYDLNEDPHALLNLASGRGYLQMRPQLEDLKRRLRRLRPLRDEKEMRAMELEAKKMKYWDQPGIEN